MNYKSTEIRLDDDDNNKKPRASDEYWFKLVNPDGNTYQNTSTDRVVMSGSPDVIDFRRAVRTEFPNTLALIDAGQLRVYKNQDAFNRRNNVADDGTVHPLDVDCEIYEFGQRKEEALIVVVPEPPPLPQYESVQEQSTQELERPSTLDMETLQSFVQCAHNVRLDKAGIVLDLGVESVFLTNTEYGIFVREEYLTVNNIIVHARATTPKLKRILVLGSPGIGKSVFGVLLFLLAIKEKKCVAYRAIGHATCYFTWNGSIYDISYHAQSGYTYEGFFDGDGNGADPLNHELLKPAYVFSLLLFVS